MLQDVTVSQVYLFPFGWLMFVALGSFSLLKMRVTLDLSKNFDERNQICDEN